MATFNATVPLGQPPLRIWELDSNSTRYDRIVAAPSDEVLQLMWTLWSILAFVAAIFVSIVFIAILSSKSVRRKPFNVYLLYLMIPDLFFAFSCAITCSLNAASGHYYSSEMCQFQSFYVAWAVTANSWVNAAIARQLHLMLRSSYTIRIRYHVPTILQVSKEAALCYLFATFVASWVFIGANLEWWPHRTAAMSGQVCLPEEFDLGSTLFFYLVFVPCMTIIPLLYAAWVCFDIWKNNLMPSRGKRRLLSIYFVRIIAVFVGMWLPFIVLVYIAGYWLSPWVLWTGGVFAHLQALASAAMSLHKPDMAEAFRDVVCCRVAWGSLRSPENDTRTTLPPEQQEGRCEHDEPAEGVEANDISLYI
jgi:hypothetical protein